jgi:hypothetical protein
LVGLLVRHLVQPGIQGRLIAADGRLMSYFGEFSGRTGKPELGGSRRRVAEES